MSLPWFMGTIGPVLYGLQSMDIAISTWTCATIFVAKLPWAGKLGNFAITEMIDNISNETIKALEVIGKLEADARDGITAVWPQQLSMVSVSRQSVGMATKCHSWSHCNAKPLGILLKRFGTIRKCALLKSILHSDQKRSPVPSSIADMVHEYRKRP